MLRPGSTVRTATALGAFCVASMVPCAGVWALDIEGVQPVAIDQPRVNAVISAPGSGDIYYADVSGVVAFNIQAFFDTGASGVLLSNNTATLLGDLLNPSIPTASIGGKPLVFEDIGVAGADRFGVSQPVNIHVAPYHPDTEMAIYDAESAFESTGDTSAIPTIYTQRFDGIKTQIGPIEPDPANQNPLLSDLDVFGMPLMRNKVVVLDPTPTNTFADTIRTYVYDPSDARIPMTQYSVKLSYASFARFTDHRLLESTEPNIYSAPLSVAQLGNQGVTLEDNPFIGPDPTLKLSGQTDPTTPDIVITRAVPGSPQGAAPLSTHGSWLLDTGAAASIISTEQAASVHVRYIPGTFGGDDRALEYFDPLNPLAPGTPLGTNEQFLLTIGGIGGTLPVAGFWLDSLTVPTQQGEPITFKSVPVLVGDVTVADPNDPNITLTLDGIFGMNLLAATIFVSENPNSPLGMDLDFGSLTEGAFTDIVLDFSSASHGIMGLNVVPEPGSAGLVVMALAGVFLRRRRTNR